MKLTARTIANRRNARRSTGPKSAAGKAKAAQNALKHGLAIPVELDLALAPEIERLAIAIAGENPGALYLGAARKIAEAQVDLMRIRDARLALLENPRERIKPPKFLGARRAIPNFFRIKNANMRRVSNSRNVGGDENGAALEHDLALAPVADETHAVVDGLIGGDARALPLTKRLDALGPKLATLDRYERRALSRRKRAMREFDALVMADESGGVSSVRASWHHQEKSAG